jgi:hypothetical protein
MNWILKHKIISIVMTVLVVGIAWYFLSGSSSAPTAVLSSEASSQSPAGTDQLISSLLALRSVTLGGTIFSNPSFQVLQDFTTPIVPEPVGRPNPFAPLDTTITTTATKTTLPQTNGVQKVIPKR